MLVHPGVNAFLIVGHLQFLNFETAIPSLNISKNCCNFAEFSDHTLSFIVHRQVLITLERVPLNGKTSRLGGCVGKLTRNNDTRASHASDAAWRGEGPIKREYISCNDKTCTSKFNLNPLLKTLTVYCGEQSVYEYMLCYTIQYYTIGIFVIT